MGMAWQRVGVNRKPCSCGFVQRLTQRAATVRIGKVLFESGPVAQLGARFHGMEEVVGSIPTRSTKSPNNLDGANACSDGVCVVVCVITRRSGAYSESFHSGALGFHAHVAVPLQHATADVTGNRHDR